MLPKPRSSIIRPTETVALRSSFTDADGNLANTDSYPQITIVQPSGNVALGPTSAGVYNIGLGQYGFDYQVGINGSYGVWSDLWSGTVDGYQSFSSWQFMVFETQMQAPNTDGYYHLGDDVGFDYGQEAIQNIGKILKVVKARLNSSGRSKATDKYGNVIYVDCDIYSTDVLVTMIAESLSRFNQMPFFTMFSFEDHEFVKQFLSVLAQGAVLQALSSKALIEKGREFTITDNGISFTPPTIGEMLSTQYSTELTSYMETLKAIKHSLPPHPAGLGTLTITVARNPLISQLRARRAKQVI